MKKFFSFIAISILFAACARPAKITNAPVWQGDTVEWNELDPYIYRELGFHLNNGRALTPHFHQMEEMKPICWSGYIYTYENNKLFYSLTECNHSEEFDKDAYLREK